MSGIIGEVVLNVVTNETAVGKSMKRISDKARIFGRDIGNDVGNSLNGITSLAKKAGLALSGAFAIKQLIAFGNQCIELGSDLAEVQNVVDVTFPKMSKQIDEFAKNAAGSFGLSETMAKKFTGTFGSMAEAFGFTEKEAADMSMTLTGLAGDVASFYNIGQDEAYTKLKSVFSGETETLKDLGIVMTQSALDSFALANGYGKVTKQMTEAEKVSLRYAFVQKQLTNATGDFSRTADSWANQMRVLKLRIDSIKASIGQGLINVLNPVLQLFNQLISKIDVLAQKFKDFTEMIWGDSGGSSNTVSDAVNDMTDAVTAAGESTADTAEDIERDVMGFDSINKLSKSATSGTSGTGNSSGTTSGIGGDTVGGIEEQKAVGGFLGTLKKYINDGDWYGIGEAISSKLSNALLNINWTSAQTACKRVAENTVSFINGALMGTNWNAIGSTIANGLNTSIKMVNTFDKNFDWTSLGTSISTSINSFFENFDFTEAGNTWSNYWTDMQTASIEALEGISWDNIGKKIAEMINAIDWNKYFKNMGTIGADVINAISSSAISFANTFDWKKFGLSISNGINRFFSRTNWGDIGEAASNIARGFLNSITTAINNIDFKKIGQSVRRLIKSIDWGGIAKDMISLLKGAFGGLVDFFNGLLNPSDAEIAGLEDYVSAVEKMCDNVDDFVKAQEENRSAVEKDYGAIKLMADKYFELADNFDTLTDSEKELLKSYATEIVNKCPELGQYIDTTTGKFTGQKEEIYNTIDAMKEYALQVAAQNELAELYQKQIELDMDIQENDAKKDALANKFKSEIESMANGDELLNKAAKELLDNYLKEQNTTIDKLDLKQLKDLYTYIRFYTGYGFFSGPDKLTAEYDVLKESSNQLSQAQIDLNIEFQNVEKTLSGVNEKTDKAAESTDDFKKSTDKATESSEEYNKELGNTGKSASSAEKGLTSQKSKFETAVSNFFKNPKNTLKQFVSDAKTSGASAGTNIANGIGSKKDYAGKCSNSLVGAISGEFNKLKNNAKTSGEGVSVGLSNGVGAKNTYAKSCANSLMVSIGNVFTNFKNDSNGTGVGISVGLSNGVGGKNAYAKSCSNSLVGAIGSIFSNFKNGSNDTGKGISTSLSNGIGEYNSKSYAERCSNSLIGAISGTFNKFKNNAKTSGEDASKKIAEGITAAGNTPVTGMVSVANNVISGFTSVFNLDKTTSETLNKWAGNAVKLVEKIFNIKSPSRVFKKIGSYVVEGFNNGIANESRNTEEQMTKWANTVSDTNFSIDGMDSKFNAIISGFASAIDLLINNLTTGLFNIKNGIMSLNGVDMRAITPALALTGTGNNSELPVLMKLLKENNGSKKEMIELLKKIALLIESIDPDIKLDGKSVKDSVVRLINQQTKATGVCEILY